TGNKYVLDGGSQTFTFTPNYGYGIATVLVDGTNDPVAVSTGTYTFSGITADHTIAVSYAMITPYTVSGHVAAAAGGGATVSFKSAANAVPSLSTTTDIFGDYNLLVPSVTWYACASQTGFIVSADQTLNVSGPMTGVDFTLDASARNIPKMESMILGVNTDSLTMPSDDPIPAWPTLYPVSGSLTPLPIVPPTLMIVAGAKWEKNTVANLDGFRFGTSYWPVGGAKASIPCSGATIVASVRPDRSAGDNLNFKAIVNIFYSRLCLVTQNLSGLVGVRRNTSLTGNVTTWSTYALPDLTGATLSLVAQPDGSYIVYANGNQIMTGPATAEGLTALVPGVLSNTEGAYDTFIDIGRTDIDPWNVFNGGISDVYIYNTALSVADRTALETDIQSNRAVSYKITASAEAGGSISPSGNVIVDYGMPKTFTITPLDGFGIATVLVDSINDPAAVSSGAYTFDSVTADHTIVATFYALAPHTVTASAEANGAISPSGAVIVFEGKSKTFTITPSFGYDIATVLVDNINDPDAVSTGIYTFTNVTADHTIAAAFAPKLEYAVSGQVTDSLSALGVPFAKVYFSRTANASVSPYRMATADVDGNFNITLFDAAWYMCASHETHATSADQTVNVNAEPISGLSIILVENYRTIPAKDKLLFSALTSAFPAEQDASTGAWTVDHPFGLAAFAMMNTPTVDLDGSLPWEKNLNADGDGFMVMGPLTNTVPSTPSLTIPCNGATIVVAVKPVRDASLVYGSLVNIFRQNLVLAIRNDTGVVNVWRNATGINNRVTANASTAIPDQQKTVLVLVVQPAGDFKVYANGVMIMNIPTTTMNGYGNTFMAFVPNQQGTENTKKYINIGRANADTNSYFNGNTYLLLTTPPSAVR
ncbi:MAG: hypothetical protein NT018_09185, partial [Armatimonadetes bacterium]|nr:hypothetical protein [Armatimonadota bacterium]